MALAFAGFSPLVGTLQNRKIIQTRYITLISLMTAVIAHLLLGPSPYLPFIHFQSKFSPFFGMCFIGFTVAFAFVPLIAELIDAVEQKEGFKADVIADKCSAVYSSTWSFGSIVAPITGGLLYDHVGFLKTC